jgi:hypothetical protein
MREELLLDVSHRQAVFTVPKMLRLFFRYKRALLSPLSLATVYALLKYFHTVTGHELMPGVVAVTQTFGDRINFHPHILAAEGGTAPDGAFPHVPASMRSSPFCFGKSSSAFPLSRKSSPGATQDSTSTVKSGLKPRERQRESANT